MGMHTKKTWEPVPKQETRTYPDAIFYDFQSYLNKTQRKEATASLTSENAYVPISVSIGNTMERPPSISVTPAQKSCRSGEARKIALW